MSLLSKMDQVEALVVRIHRGKAIERKGRGFSKAELDTANLDGDHALSLGIIVDPKRKSRHESNVNILRTLKEKAPAEATTAGS